MERKRKSMKERKERNKLRESVADMENQQDGNDNTETDHYPPPNNERM